MSKFKNVSARIVSHRETDLEMAKARLMKVAHAIAAGKHATRPMTSKALPALVLQKPQKEQVSFQV